MILIINIVAWVLKKYKEGRVSQSMDECVYVQRCVSVDDYLTAPIPQLDHVTCPLSGLPIRRVPVLRVYGATQIGQKACIHIHRVYPYLCIPVHEIPGGGVVAQEIFTELESSLNRSYGSSNGQFVHNIVQISGIPFYGFHEEEVKFLKIYFYQPRYVKRTAQLLLQGSLRGKLVQPHEAHFPYSLQFLTDYNIHGMNLIYFKRVFFRVKEDQYNKLTVGEDTSYLQHDIDVNTIPQKHMVNPELAVKKCSSSLELDTTADCILNINFIDVNCNPGLKAICEEERQRRHQAGNFTPSNVTETPPRRKASLPQTKRWEDKLGNIIQNASCLSPSSQKYDSDVVDFLLDLNASQSSSQLDFIASQRSDSTPSKPSSQRSNPLSQGNLSIFCKEEENESSEDENEMSIMMSQRVFYDTAPDNLNVENSNTAHTAVQCTDSDEDYFDEITASQLQQLDGNNEVEPSKETTRKRKRLGGRPAFATSSSSHTSVGSFNRVLRNSRRVEENLLKEQPQKICTRDSGSSRKPNKSKLNLSIKKKTIPADAIARLQPDGKEAASCSKKSPEDNENPADRCSLASVKDVPSSKKSSKISDFINLTQRSPTVKNNVSSARNSPKLVTKLDFSQNSPDIDFSLSQFNDLKNSPKTTQEKRYKGLRIVSPGSNKSVETRLSLSRRKKKKKISAARSKEKNNLPKTPTKDNPGQNQPFNDDVVIPKKLFSPSSDSPKTKILKALGRMELERLDSDQLSIDSFNTEPEDTVLGSLGSESPKKKKSHKDPSGENDHSISREMKIIEQEQQNVDNKVLMWLTESECSQDEHEDDSDSQKISPEKAPDKAPYKVSDKTPDKVPDKVPDRVSDKVPDKAFASNLVADDKFSETPPTSANPSCETNLTSKASISFEFSKDSFSYSPKSPGLSRKRNVSNASNKSSISLFDSVNHEKYLSNDSSTDIIQQSPKHDCSSSGSTRPPFQTGSPDLSKISVASPVILSSSPEISHVSEASPAHRSTSPNDSKISVTSPIVLSGSEVENNSLLSTPRNIEFDTSMFFSQYQVDENTGIVREPEVQNLRYKISPPSFLDCQKYIQQPRENSNISAIQPYYSSLKDVPDAIRIGAKHINLKHLDTLPDQMFYPECENDLGILGLESWEGVMEEKYIKSEVSLVSKKYSFNPPKLSDARLWLMKKKKSKISLNESQTTSSSVSEQSKVKYPSGESDYLLSPENLKSKDETESLPSGACSTPINSKAKFSSLPDKFITPIAPKNPISRFKKKVKFSPRNDSLKPPISPTLAMNSQISHLSNNDSFKFAMTVPMGDSTRSHIVQHLTVMSIETFASSIGDKKSDPRYDPVISVFYALYNDSKDGITEGSITVTPPCKPKCVPPYTNFVDSESEVFEEIFKIVHEYDPDILVGYEIKTSSLGYLIERANVIGLNFQANISRFPEETKDVKEEGSEEGPSNWWVTVSNEIQLAGRVILNLWRLMRTEVNLTNYSFESIAYHVLHERIPKLPMATLDSFYQDPKFYFNFADYFITRTRSNLRLLLDLNIIVRTSEMGRLFGIEFFNVLSRGSQYRVESMMSRLAKPRKFISISPSPEQRAMMAAPELIPLVMEPESKFYGDPVVVLDFQSLYPTMIIAYNMCFSTCLGRVNYLGTYGSFPFGATHLTVPPNLLMKYQEHIFVSPNGVAFVEDSVRRGVLPMMLNEILETRIMVKQMMKQHKDDKALYKMLDARQMALKLIANVTYGYTSANFSGRMPCIEIGDSIVAKGRETLETAIDLVNKTPKWGGRVVYGDTDSLFILFEGCSRAEAFTRGQQIADVVTGMNPKPVKLKFEKVYQPCVLQTKKRYVGMKYETVDDPGEYEAKGIETVRRDGCPASVKTLKRALHILFKSRDISSVKTFVQNQFLKIIKNKISVQDYIFAKEYRGKDSYRPGACVPALEIAKRRIKTDPRNEPFVGERVQYVICYGTPGLPLIQLVHEPADILFSSNLHINTIYYITKAIVPPLQRVFGLMGVNVMEWYNELPRDLRTHFSGATTRGKHTISHYYHTKHCPFCDKVSDTLCVCYLDRQKAGVLSQSQLSLLKSQEQSVFMICSDCSNVPSVVANPDASHNRNCVSFVCPVLFKRISIRNRISERQVIKDEVFKLYNW
ncbi:DNA polymerase zeta catalytic subunit-like isoform X2 [Bolinopsis microptera]|uniref:DNA polymerase zeta catalytic subunit-like isoform X2 n=1 Tax=Bolinopsis microptera TaxID=2820187 RepID=UPI003079471F